MTLILRGECDKNTWAVHPLWFHYLMRVHVNKAEALGSWGLRFDQADISFIQIGKGVQGLQDGIH